MLYDNLHSCFDLDSFFPRSPAMEFHDTTTDLPVWPRLIFLLMLWLRLTLTSLISPFTFLFESIYSVSYSLSLYLSPASASLTSVLVLMSRLPMLLSPVKYVAIIISIAFLDYVWISTSSKRHKSLFFDEILSIFPSTTAFPHNCLTNWKTISPSSGSSHSL